MDILLRTRYAGPRTNADAVPTFPFLLLPQTGEVGKAHGVRQPDGWVAEEVKPSVLDPPRPTAVKGGRSTVLRSTAGSAALSTGASSAHLSALPSMVSTASSGVSGPGRADGTAARLQPATSAEWPQLKSLAPGLVPAPGQKPPGFGRLSPLVLLKEQPPGAIAADGVFVATHGDARIAGVTVPHGIGHEGAYADHVQARLGTSALPSPMHTSPAQGGVGGPSAAGSSPGGDHPPPPPPPVPPGLAAAAPAYLNTMSGDDYDRLRRSLRTYHEDKMEARRREARAALLAEARALRFATALMRVQKWWREHAARWKAWHERPRTAPLAIRDDAATTIQRAWNERRMDKLRPYARLRFKEVVSSVASFLSERTAKRRMDLVRLASAATRIQALFRGFLARRIVRALKRHVEKKSHAGDAAVKIQAAWRMYALRKLYRQLVILGLAATQIQRVWRGYSCRRRTARLRELSLLGPEKRAAFLLVEAERKHASYTAYQKGILMLQMQMRTLQSRVSAHGRTVDRLRAVQTRAAKELAEVRKAHAWLEHFADNHRRLERVAYLMHEDVRIAEREFRGKLETNHRWFAEAFGDASLGMTHRVSMTQLLANVFTSVARKIDSRTAVASIARTLALDLRIKVAEHAPEVQAAESRAAAAAREMDGLDEELAAARRAIEDRQAEIARRSRNLRAMEDDLSELLTDVKSTDEEANAKFGIPLPFKEATALDDAPSIRKAVAARLAKQALAAARPSMMLTAGPASSAGGRLFMSQNHSQPLQLTSGAGGAGGLGDTARSAFSLGLGSTAVSRRHDDMASTASHASDSVDTGVPGAGGGGAGGGAGAGVPHALAIAPGTRIVQPKLPVPPDIELFAQRIERQMAAFMKGATLPGIATLSAVRAHRAHQVALVEAEVSPSDAADLLGPLRSGGPLAMDLGLPANTRLDMHRRVGERFMALRADEAKRREAEKAWRRGAAPPRLSSRGIYDKPLHRQIAGEKNFGKLIRTAAWAGVAPKAVADVVINSGARGGKPESEAGSLRGNPSIADLERPGAGRRRDGPGGEKPTSEWDEYNSGETARKAVAAEDDGTSMDYIQPLGIDLPFPGAEISLATRHATVSDLGMGSLLLNMEPDRAEAAAARRDRRAERLLAGLPADSPPASPKHQALSASQSQLMLQSQQMPALTAGPSVLMLEGGEAGSLDSSFTVAGSPRDGDADGAAGGARLGARGSLGLPGGAGATSVPSLNLSMSLVSERALPLSGPAAAAAGGRGRPPTPGAAAGGQIQRGAASSSGVSTRVRPAADPRGMSNLPSQYTGVTDGDADGRSAADNGGAEYGAEDEDEDFVVRSPRGDAGGAAGDGEADGDTRLERPLAETDDLGRAPRGLHLAFPRTKPRVRPGARPTVTLKSQVRDFIADAGLGSGTAGQVGALIPHGVDSRLDAAAAHEAMVADHREAIVLAGGGGAGGAGYDGAIVPAGGRSDQQILAAAAAAKRAAAVPALVKMMLKAMPAEGRVVNPMRSVARDFKGHFASLLTARVDSMLKPNAEMRALIPQSTLDPAAEYIPPHVRAAQEEAERPPFMGPEEATKAVEDDAARTAEIHAFPGDVLRYTVEDVAWWVAKCGLTKYRLLFANAGINGETLMQMKPDDFISVIGITDYHHINMLLAERELLVAESASAQLRKLADPLDHEAKTAALKIRMASRAPNWQAVFAAAKAGRVQQVADAIRYGFDIETEDDEGNTLFLMAAMNGHKRLLDLLLSRGCNMNHQNNEGNCALHYCMDAGTRRLADPDGAIAKYLIMHGAHAELRNKYGMEPYQGIRPGTGVGRMRAGLPAASPPGSALGMRRGGGGGGGGDAFAGSSGFSAEGLSPAASRGASRSGLRKVAFSAGGASDSTMAGHGAIPVPRPGSGSGSGSGSAGHSTPARGGAGAGVGVGAGSGRHGFGLTAPPSPLVTAGLTGAGMGHGSSAGAGAGSGAASPRRQGGGGGGPSLPPIAGTPPSTAGSSRPMTAGSSGSRPMTAASAGGSGRY